MYVVYPCTYTLLIGQRIISGFSDLEKERSVQGHEKGDVQGHGRDLKRNHIVADVRDRNSESLDASKWSLYIYNTSSHYLDSTY